MGQDTPQVSGNVVDSWFEKISEALTEKQKTDLKRKYSRMDALSKPARFDQAAKEAEISTGLHR